jgi:hypothetical protein
LYCADSAGARPRPRRDPNAARFKMGRYFGEGDRCYEAQIGRARRRLIGDETRDIVGGMQIHLLATKAQCGTTVAKMDDLHTQYPRIERAGTINVRDRQNQVIEPFDVHQWTPRISGRFEIATIGAVRPAPVAIIVRPVGH